jgi:hypothetical protein
MVTAALQARLGNLAEARRLLSTVPAPERDVWALVTLVAYQARAGDVPAALALARRIPADSSHGGVWHHMALLAAVAGQATAGDVTGALATATANVPAPEMLAAARAIVVEVQARRGQVREASRAVASLSPDADFWFVRAVYAVAVAQAEQGDVAGAFQTLKQLGSFVDHALAEVSEAQSLAGDPSGAVATATGIADPQVRVRALWRVAVARARAGDPAPLLAAANPSGSAPEARVADLAAAAPDVLDDRRLDLDDPLAYLGTQRPRWQR